MEKEERELKILEHLIVHKVPLQIIQLPEIAVLAIYLIILLVLHHLHPQLHLLLTI